MRLPACLHPVLPGTTLLTLSLRQVAVDVVVFTLDKVDLPAHQLSEIRLSREKLPVLRPARRQPPAQHARPASRLPTHTLPTLSTHRQPASNPLCAGNPPRRSLLMKRLIFWGTIAAGATAAYLMYRRGHHRPSGARRRNPNLHRSNPKERTQPV